MSTAHPKADNCFTSGCCPSPQDLSGVEHAVSKLDNGRQAIATTSEPCSIMGYGHLRHGLGPLQTGECHSIRRARATASELGSVLRSRHARQGGCPGQSGQHQKVHCCCPRPMFGTGAIGHTWPRGCPHRPGPYHKGWCCCSRGMLHAGARTYVAMGKPLMDSVRRRIAAAQEPCSRLKQGSTWQGECPWQAGQRQRGRRCCPHPAPERCVIWTPGRPSCSACTRMPRGELQLQPWLPFPPAAISPAAS